MGRLSTVNVAVALLGYGILFYGYSDLKNAGLGFTDIWLPSKRSQVVTAMHNAQSTSGTTRVPTGPPTLTNPGAPGHAPGEPCAVGCELQLQPDGSKKCYCPPPLSPCPPGCTPQVNERGMVCNCNTSNMAQLMGAGAGSR